MCEWLKMSVGGSGFVVESGDAEAGGGVVVVAAQAGRLNNDLLGLPSAMRKMASV